MEILRDLIENKEIGLPEFVVQAIDEVKKRGDVFVLKKDGERESKGYTIFITRPSTGAEMIRFDDDDLRTAITEVLCRYVSDSVVGK